MHIDENNFSSIELQLQVVLAALEKAENIFLIENFLFNALVMVFPIFPSPVLHNVRRFWFARSSGHFSFFFFNYT